MVESNDIEMLEQFNNDFRDSKKRQMRILQRHQCNKSNGRIPNQTGQVTRPRHIRHTTKDRTKEARNGGQRKRNRNTTNHNGREAKEVIGRTSSNKAKIHR